MGKNNKRNKKYSKRNLKINKRDNFSSFKSNISEIKLEDNVNIKKEDKNIQNNKDKIKFENNVSIEKQNISIENNKIILEDNIKIEKQNIDIEIKNVKKKILSNKIRFILLSLLALILLILVVWFVILSPNIVLNGEKNITLEVNEDYKELGYSANYLGKNLTNDVIINNKLDNKKIGKYQIEYIIRYNGRIKKVIRNIEVTDTKRPVLELVGDKNFYVCPNKEYEEKGYKSIDNYDGDITDKVEIKYNNDEIIYEVKDSSNNKTTVIRKLIKKDIEKPVITLNGNQEEIIYLGNNYQESGYSAVDNCDSDITNKVKIESNLINNQVGTYKITYKVQDSSGNESSIDRTIKVLNPISTGKVIYLTFDDGPSPITNQILSILKEENVKATFFVIGNANNYQEVIKREVNDGHTVALHTFTHNYKTLYNSSDAYFEDLDMIRNTVYNITGRYSNIIRFPGGSSNTISRNYQKGLMTYLVKEVEQRGFTYFDWNVSSEDAGGARNSSDVYYNVVNNLRYKNNIVLLHDFGGNYKTLNALRDIIRYGKNNGYTFETITEYTEPVHHRVNN